MARSPQNLYRVRGELSVGSDALGYTARDRACFSAAFIYDKEPLYNEVSGSTIVGMLKVGDALSWRIELIEWKSAVLAKCFPGLTSGLTASVDPETVPPGYRMDSDSNLRFTLSFTSDDGVFNVSADRTICAVSATPVDFGRGEELMVTLEGDAVWDGSGALYSFTV